MQHSGTLNAAAGMPQEARLPRRGSPALWHRACSDGCCDVSRRRETSALPGLSAIRPTTATKRA